MDYLTAFLIFDAGFIFGVLAMALFITKTGCYEDCRMRDDFTWSKKCPTPSA